VGALRAAEIARGGEARHAHGRDRTHRLTVDDKGVEVGTPYGALRVYWHGIQEIVLSSDQVLFYNGQHTAMIVPRRAFASDREVGGFVGAANDRRNAAMARPVVA
jgi:hypothetical protein